MQLVYRVYSHGCCIEEEGGRQRKFYNLEKQAETGQWKTPQTTVLFLFLFFPTGNGEDLKYLSSGMSK